MVPDVPPAAADAPQPPPRRQALRLWAWVRRRDSLFARLLLLQIGLVLALGLLVGLLFYSERNVTIARLQAERWAPTLAAAADLPLGTAAVVAPALQVQRQLDVPEGSQVTSPFAPRFAALRQALQAQGLPVRQLWLDLRPGRSTVWLELVPPGRAPLWLGMPGQEVVPEWSSRSLWALLAGGALLIGACWLFTRWMTLPLDQLRRRMQAHEPGRAPLADGPAGGEQAWGAATPELRSISRAYNALLDRQDRHERERTLLLAGVSHDLRSPLGRIRMAAELLPDQPGVQVRQQAIVRNVQVADGLIQSFLDHVRAGQLPMTETVDLAETARQQLASLDLPADTLRLEAPAHLPEARHHPLLFERLLANLVDNALKHGRPPVQVQLAQDEHRTWLRVSDGGQGLDPADAARLQEAFARGDDSRRRPGLGLGLAIVRQVLERLGGDMQFERPADGPASVRVSWPRRP